MAGWRSTFSNSKHIFKWWISQLYVSLPERFPSNQLQDRHFTSWLMNSNIKSSTKKYLKHLYHLESRWLATPISIHLSWPRSLVATFLGVASHLLSLRVMLCKYSLKDHALLQPSPKPHFSPKVHSLKRKIFNGCTDLPWKIWKIVRKPLVVKYIPFAPWDERNIYLHLASILW